MAVPAKQPEIITKLKTVKDLLTNQQHTVTLERFGKICEMFGPLKPQRYFFIFF
jgi:hypothetical protein